MLNGLYSSATAMEAASKRHEVIANNLANLNSPGFKRTLITQQVRVLDSPAANANHSHLDLIGTLTDTGHLDFSPGPIRSTGQQLDVAIDGEGFFTIQSPNGPLYTRNGSFRLSESGELVTSDGLPVLAGGKPIQIPAGISYSQIKIDLTGTIRVGTNELGQLDIRRFANPAQLEQVGATRYRAPRGAGEVVEDPRVHQGALESSNSVAITEMIRMITGLRHFEASQQTLKAISEAIQQYTNLDS